MGRQHGYNACTFTAGVNSFNKNYLHVFKDKEVIIAYDGDDAGDKGSRNIKGSLGGASKIHIATLPSGKDISDVIREGGRELLDKIISSAGAGEQQVEEISLEKSSLTEHFGKSIKLDVRVSGKDLAPYLIPAKVDVEGELIELSLSPIEKIELIGGSRKVIKEHVKRLIRSKFLPNFSNKEMESIERLQLIPEVTFSEDSGGYTSREAYYIGQGIQTNKAYKIVATVVPHPKNQSAVLYVTEANMSESSLDKFKISKEMADTLRVTFNTDSPIRKLVDISTNLSYHVTQIYKRQDIIIGSDLVFHSALEFNFGGKLIRKGVVEGLIVGDTQCGKTETIRALISHYKVGEIVTGETASFSGLIGGVQKLGDRWILTWGKFPLNNKKLLALDEISGLSTETLGILSGVRSSGIAEITKIREERTEARVRLIWIGNPRDGKAMGEYSYGILAADELMGSKPEDIARLDFAMGVAKEEVSLNEIREEKRKAGQENIYTEGVCSNLIMWVWSRKADQIKITPKAESLIYEESERLNKIYSATIPLVDQAQFPVRLAKLSVAVAGRLFSTDETNENIIVNPCHVEAAVWFLERAYKNIYFDYIGYSKFQMKATFATKGDIDILIRKFTSFPDWKIARDFLLQSPHISDYDARKLLSEQISSTDFYLWLLKDKLLYKYGAGYRKTKKLVRLLKVMIREDKDEEVEEKRYF